MKNNNSKCEHEDFAVVQVKNVCVLSVGNYEMTVDEDKMSMLYCLSHSKTEYSQINDLNNFIIDLMDGCPDETEMMKMLRYLRNIRGFIDYIAGLDVRMKGGIENA